MVKKNLQSYSSWELQSSFDEGDGDSQCINGLYRRRHGRRLDSVIRQNTLPSTTGSLNALPRMKPLTPSSAYLHDWLMSKLTEDEQTEVPEAMREMLATAPDTKSIE